MKLATGQGYLMLLDFDKLGMRMCWNLRRNLQNCIFDNVGQLSYELLCAAMKHVALVSHEDLLNMFCGSYIAAVLLKYQCQ